MEQFSHPVSYKEAKTIIKNEFRALLREKHGDGLQFDAIHHLDRRQQTTIFRLRTGHCRLLSHMHRLGISHTPECPCNTGIQSAEHILQDCPTFSDLRKKTWPNGTDLDTKLWGDYPNLERTVGFVAAAGLNV